MQSLLLTKLASERLSIWVSITLMFTYTILLDRDFECTCKKSQEFHCDLYLSLPIFIILFLVLWTDGSFQRVCTDLFSGGRNTKKFIFCDFFFRHILKAVLVGLLWVAFVLLDGDWYVCCRKDQSELERPLACKAKDNITEKERVIIAELKNWSRVYGSFTVFGIVLGLFLLPLFLLLVKCREGNDLNDEDNTENMENPSPGTSTNQKDPSPGTSTDQELQVKQKDNKQHEEQEDRM